MVVWITGASRGLGLDIARACVEAGHTVIGTVRDDAGAARLSETGALVERLDVTDAGQTDAVVCRIVARHGRLDALVANAGLGLFGCFEDVDDDQARALFDVNVFGLMNSARSALPHLRESQGRLVLLSSIAGRRSAPGSSLYNSTKFAVEGLGEALRLELHPFGVPVVLIEPGPTASDFASSSWRGRRVGTGAYAAISEHLEGLRQQVFASVEPSSTVTRAVLRALASPRPPLRMPTGRATHLQLALLRVLPFPVWEQLVHLRIRLPRAR